MSLTENTLFGKTDKVQIAMARIREFEPMALINNPAGYHVCISGGKDSSVIQELCIMAGVKCEFVHSHTSADQPETVYFVRREQERIIEKGYSFRIEYPRWRNGKIKTMWNMIPVRGLPRRDWRWCCGQLKEFAGHNRYCVTGVRWAESVKRANSRGLHEISGGTVNDHIVFNNDNDMSRKMSELCLRKRQFVLNPIVDWSDDDVWEFIAAYKLPINPLYGMGWKRVGCIGCPLSSNGRKELDLFPKYKAAYLRAAERHIEYKRKSDRALPDFMKDAESYFEWWLRG